MLLDKIQFWVVLIWMIAMLVMAVWAVRMVWKEDTRTPTEPDDDPPGEAGAQEAAKPDVTGPGQ